MEAQSRTKKSMINSIVALIIFFINLILQFFFRKIFLDNLGSDVLGLNTTATNLLQFLNLAELGIGVAIASTLYKPIFNKDINPINEIISLQGWLYRKIAYFLIIGSIILMLFFPLIFSKINIPLWYAYATYSVLLYSSLLGYFINYKQIILSASQQDYKIQISYRIPLLIKVFCQIIAIRLFNDGYLWWLGLEIAFATIASICLSSEIKRCFPEVITSVKQGSDLRKKYPDIVLKIKQVFVHKIGTFALTQASPLIIYAYTTLNVIAIYGNYFLITNGIGVLVQSIFNSMGAGVGNLIAQGDKQRILRVFEELFTLRFSISAILVCGLVLFTQIFVSIWVGTPYLFNISTLILLLAICYITITRNTVDAFLNGYGLFKDIWAPIAEAVLNISLSISLGFFYGINGVLSGIIISQIIIIMIWKPYFLFSQGFNMSIFKYIILYGKCIISCFICGYLTYILNYYIVFSLYNITISNIIKGGLLLLFFSITIISSLYMTTQGMKDGIKRLFHLIKR